jgi:hypothetical protein
VKDDTFIVQRTIDKKYRKMSSRALYSFLHIVQKFAICGMKKAMKKCALEKTVCVKRPTTKRTTTKGPTTKRPSGKKPTHEKADK